MPVQVNEIVIRAIIKDEKGSEKKTEGDKTDKEEIISECVEQVLQIIKEKTER